MSLRTGTQLILLTLIINKVSGFYGLLALLTGVHLSPLQLSMYIYSLLALAISVHLSPHIRLHSPLQCLALAYFYALDSLINAAYTAAFAVGWFMVLADDENSSKAPGGSTMSDTAGFNDPLLPNVSWVEIAPSGQAPGAVSIVVTDGNSTDTATAAEIIAESGMIDFILHSSGLASLVIIGTLLAIRLYFIIVIFSFARQVLRSHMLDMRFASTSSSNNFTSPMPNIIITDGSLSAGSGSIGDGNTDNSNSSSNLGKGNSIRSSPGVSPARINYNNNKINSRSSPPPSEQYLQQPFNPISPFRSDLHRWQDKLGKVMLSLGRSYWFGGWSDADGVDDIELMRSANGNFRDRLYRNGGYYSDAGAGAGAGADAGNGTARAGVGERERRRRSGTGPPLPPAPAPSFVGVKDLSNGSESSGALDQRGSTTSFGHER